MVPPDVDGRNIVRLLMAGLRSPGTITMLLIPQILATITALAGCVLVFNQIRLLRQRQSKNVAYLEQKLEKRANSIKKMQAQYQNAHRQLMRQLEQAELYYEIEHELATRLADVEGGKPVSKKSLARNVVIERRGGDIHLISKVTTPSGIRDLKYRAEETMIETMNHEAIRSDGDTVRNEDDPSGPIFGTKVRPITLAA